MDVIGLLGRFHPMVVHFPVALLVTAVAFVALQRLRGDALGGAIALLVQLAAVSAVVAAGLGIAWAEHQGFRGSEAEAVDIHRWLTIVGGALAIVAAVLYRLWPEGKNDVFKILFLCASTALVGTGAHLGGELVHGDLLPGSSAIDDDDVVEEDVVDEDVVDEVETPAAPVVPAAPVAPLTLPAAEAGPQPVAEDEKPSPKPKPKPKAGPKPGPKAKPKPAPEKAAERTVDFKKDVWPIFDKSCHRCHGRKKKKGDLRLDKKKFAMKGSENGKVIIPGKAKKSKLYMLTTLDEDHDDAMPSKGDMLTKKQQDILKRWINEGAHWPE